MPVQTLLILLSIGLSAGALGGIFGIGGGLIMIPGLVLLLGIDQHTAIGTSLAVMLPPIGIAATYNYYKSGSVNLAYAVVIALAFIVGSFLSSKLALTLPEMTMRRIFAVFLVIMGVRMFFGKGG
ncbi:MAG TPA: sulfite exporter TauE/SafE family protein [Turneriella sp.]|nr:sulfite exporter TauE/SafE family protein [Turneriella sp.]HNM99610.1 sulfite exporter TauE/SafE family protein [Turneriella sp.]